MGMTLVSDYTRAFDTAEGRPFGIRHYFGHPLVVTPYLPFMGSLGLVVGHGAYSFNPSTLEANTGGSL